MSPTRGAPLAYLGCCPGRPSLWVLVFSKSSRTPGLPCSPRCPFNSPVRRRFSSEVLALLAGDLRPARPRGLPRGRRSPGPLSPGDLGPLARGGGQAPRYPPAPLLSLAPLPLPRRVAPGLRGASRLRVCPRRGLPASSSSRGLVSLVLGAHSRCSGSVLGPCSLCPYSAPSLRPLYARSAPPRCLGEAPGYPLAAWVRHATACA